MRDGATTLYTMAKVSFSWGREIGWIRNRRIWDAGIDKGGTQMNTLKGVSVWVTVWLVNKVPEWMAV